MANLENIAEVKLDLAVITIDSDTSPFHGGVSVKLTYTLSPVVPASVGEAIGHLVNGRAAEGQIRLIQVPLTILEKVQHLDATNKAAQIVGAKLTGVPLRIHHPGDGNAARDIYIPQAIFTGVTYTNDGKDLDELVIDFRGERTTGGVVWERGAAGAG